MFSFFSPIQLIHQEEELRQEEEAYYEAKREAARVARQQKQRDMANKGTVAVVRNGPKAWIGDDESDWEMYAYLYLDYHANVSY